MKYCVIGAGGTGGCIAAYMIRAGKDVTVIARGSHLEQIQKHGILLETEKGTETIAPVSAYEMSEYIRMCGTASAEALQEEAAKASAEKRLERPDVIFVCVKGYSLEGVIPFIREVSKSDTIVIPVLNLYGTGERLQKELPGLLVTDGCIYVAAQIKKPGTVWMNGTIFRVVFGVRDPEELRKELFEIAEDLRQSGIEAVLSENIRRDALQKFSYVSPMAAAGLCYHANAERFQVTGDERDTFVALVGEIDRLAVAMGIEFQMDIVKNNLAILDALSPEASTSMQRDIEAGKPSEIDGLIYEVVRLSGQYGIKLPMYEKMAEALKEHHEII